MKIGIANDHRAYNTKEELKSLLDDNLVEKPDKMIKDEIKSFLKENYDSSGR